MKEKLEELVKPSFLKRNFNLQLFAGDEGGDEGGSGETGDPEDKTGDGGNDDKKYTDEDVNKIINKKFAEWEKKQQKAVDEATRLANMTAQEKAEHERDEIQKELNDLKKANAIAGMQAEARKMCQTKGINVSDEILTMIVSDNADDTKKSVESFIDIFQKEVKRAIKDALKGDSPKNKKGSTFSKEQILGIKDPIERQKMIAENIELFTK